MFIMRCVMMMVYIEMAILYLQNKAIENIICKQQADNCNDLILYVYYVL